MQILRTNRKLLPQIRKFFKAIENNEFFRPHNFDGKTAKWIANYKGKNHFYFLIDEEEYGKILGYAILRGLEEGWKDKCIGICIEPDERRRGYAEILCRFLELAAKRRGLQKLRLHADENNHSAIALYHKLGYEFRGVRKNGELIGFKKLMR